MKGYSILELVVALSLVGLLVVGAGSLLKIGTGYSSSLSTKDDAASQLTNLSSAIQRVGRGGQSCAYTENSGIRKFSCSIDKNSPPTLAPSDDTSITFTYDPTQKTVTYQETGEAPTVYSGIVEFTVCNDAKMSNGTCTLENTLISSKHGANLSAAAGATATARFYRYKVSQCIEKKCDANSALFSIQSAFFVRHPTPSGLVYTWGSYDG